MLSPTDIKVIHMNGDQSLTIEWNISSGNVRSELIEARRDRVQASYAALASMDRCKQLPANLWLANKVSRAT